MSKYSKSPWSVVVNGHGIPIKEIVASDGRGICEIYEGDKPEAVWATANLIAAAPDYYEAVQAIFDACESNAAPVNLIAALRELDRQGKRISLDADLLIALFEAHAKATGK